MTKLIKPLAILGIAGLMLESAEVILNRFKPD